VLCKYVVSVRCALKLRSASHEDTGSTSSSRSIFSTSQNNSCTLWLLDCNAVTTWYCIASIYITFTSIWLSTSTSTWVLKWTSEHWQLNCKASRVQLRMRLHHFRHFSTQHTLFYVLHYSETLLLKSRVHTLNCCVNSNEIHLLEMSSGTDYWWLLLVYSRFCKTYWWTNEKLTPLLYGRDIIKQCKAEAPKNF